MFRVPCPYCRGNQTRAVAGTGDFATFGCYRCNLAIRFQKQALRVYAADPSSLGEEWLMREAPIRSAYHVPHVMLVDVGIDPPWAVF